MAASPVANEAPVEASAAAKAPVPRSGMLDMFDKGPKSSSSSSSSSPVPVSPIVRMDATDLKLFTPSAGMESDSKAGLPANSASSSIELQPLPASLNSFVTVQDEAGMKQHNAKPPASSTRSPFSRPQPRPVSKRGGRRQRLSKRSIRRKTYGTATERITEIPASAKGNVCAFDPGVTSMGTVYDARTGRGYKYGYKCVQKLTRLQDLADALKREADRAHGPRRYRLLRAWRRVLRRQKRLQQEFHRKVCDDLVKRCEWLLIPHLRVSEMVARKKDGTRKLPARVCKMMLAWGHYSFLQRLRFMMVRHPGFHVIEVREDWTSRTCGSCGYIHPPGGFREFCCPKCKQDVDRDIHAAKNILVRFLVERKGDLLI